MNQTEFTAILDRIINQDISVDPEHWSVENMFWGTCVPIALLAQDIFGGDLLRSPLDPSLYHASSHYWNRLPSGAEYDFSERQFQGSRPLLNGEIRPREHLLSNAQTKQRYLLLKSLFENFIVNSR